MHQVTIGIPLYNNERTIERCLKSIFNQTFSDYQIIIANDLSADSSLDLVKNLTAGMENVTIIDHEEKQYYNNFPFLIGQAKTKYFVWLAGDDYWEPDFLLHTTRLLDENLSLMCAVPNCRHLFEGGSTEIATDTFPLKGSLKEKISKFFEKGLNNNRMYGLFRTSAIKDCYPEKILHAQDFIFTLKTLVRGDYEEVHEVLMNREVTSLQKYAESVVRDHKFFLYRIFPFLPATFYILWQKDIPLSVFLLRKIIKQNFIMHYRQVRFIHTSYGAIFMPVYRFISNYIIWRL